MLPRGLLVLAAVVAFCAAGCGGSASGAGRTAVVAGFYPLAYAAEQVGGDRVEVTNLTPAGAEPHDLELSVGDVGRVRSADLVLYLDDLQPALTDAARDAQGKAVDLMQGLETHPGDPHVWLDPVRYARIVETVAAALGEPAGAETLTARLHALDADYRRGLTDCRRHAIVTSHAAWGYLAERYGLQQIAVVGLTPEVEPTAQEVQRTVEAVRASGATTVFLEPLVSPRIAETVAREAGAGTAVLDPLEGLTKDEAGRGEDYFSIMRTNLATLRDALACR